MLIGMTTPDYLLIAINCKRMFIVALTHLFNLHGEVVNCITICWRGTCGLVILNERIGLLVKRARALALCGCDHYLT